MRRRCSTTSAARCRGRSRSRSPRDEVYALTAYLLFLNGVVGETDVMNATTLPKVVMPNHDNFDVAYHEPRRR